MKKIALASLMMVCLPYLAVAQSVDDDLYFIPKKKAEKKEEVKQEVKVVVPQKQNTTTVYVAPGSTVVVKDVKGKIRDVDEYNRRYTSRDNNFSRENDTLYIEEKPLNERGEWVNGFEGSQDDYEYAMRIVRFRNPRYAIPVSSPLYWDVVYGLPSWDWNVYDDGFYAYAFPTYTNRLWWDWRWNYPYGAGWGFSWGWTSPWYYNSWYAPGYWSGGYWGGYWGHHHHHYYPGHGWGGGHWGGSHGWARPYYDNRRAEARSRGNSFIGTSGNRHANRYSTGRVDRSSYRSSRDGNSRVAGRVVSGNRVAGNTNSVRPDRNTGSRGEATTNNSVSRGDRTRPTTTYTRPGMSNRGESTYTRPSSTRSSVRNGNSSAYQRNSAVNRSSNYNRNERSSYNSSRTTYNSNRSSSRSSFNSGTSSSRSSYSSGGSGGTSSRSSGGGGARRR